MAPALVFEPLKLFDDLARCNEKKGSVAVLGSLNP